MRALCLLLLSCTIQPIWQQPTLPQPASLPVLVPIQGNAPSTLPTTLSERSSAYDVHVIEEQRVEENLELKALPSRREQHLTLSQTSNTSPTLQLGLTLPAANQSLLLPILGEKQLTPHWMGSYHWGDELVLQYRFSQSWKQSLADDELLTLITEHCLIDWYVLARDGSILWSEVFVSRSIEEIARNGAHKKSSWKANIESRRRE
jgi:hypothetical protein